MAELFVTEPLTFWISLGILVLQLSMAWALRDAEWYAILPAAYIIGGTANHSLQLAVHELSHDLCWSGPHKDTLNRLTAIMANLPTGFPSGQTFKPYHMDHHQYQGVDGVDTDIPHAIELNWVTNTFMKVMWIFGQSRNRLTDGDGACARFELVVFICDCIHSAHHIASQQTKHTSQSFETRQTHL